MCLIRMEEEEMVVQRVRAVVKTGMNQTEKCC